MFYRGMRKGDDEKASFLGYRIYHGCEDIATFSLGMGVKSTVLCLPCAQGK